ncbi:hypothetical protein DN820_16515 [Stutzerimonas nosocomialis]|uniref:Uncharacterized protein n=1 Tax=Stutzerimonas nosocomialis TaxID=1056496 RepID=A0A5R9QBA7_9GAMM|nr:hypothetical protein [Stutzerimonas nosocomialis]TLX62419.1 hypothetical protein DN820_16515 [Stutzerimonas nosocomialis]
MKSPIRAALLVSALLLPSIVHASDASLTDTFRAFARCDASFFASLKANADVWGSHAPLEHSDHATWIAVDNRGSRTANSVSLSNSPQVAGMRLLSYFDQSLDLGSMGYYLYWGFVVEGRAEEAARHIAPLLNERLQKWDSVYVRSEVKQGDHWLPIKVQPGSAPGTNRLERVLLIEPEGSEGDRTRVSCSLQGAVDGALLAGMRPDIPPSDYPQQVPNTEISDVALHESLSKKVDLPLLQPNFRSLNYTYELQKNGVGRASSVSVIVEVEGGLLRKTERYGTFQVERLTKADLIQLKSKMVGLGDGRVLRTREIALTVPDGWSPGQMLSARILMEQVPVKPNDEPSETLMVCEIGRRYPAQQVFASLSGDAIQLECSHGKERTSRAFIEGLGIALLLESTSGSTRYGYKITTLEAVR